MSVYQGHKKDFASGAWKKTRYRYKASHIKIWCRNDGTYHYWPAACYPWWVTLRRGVLQTTTTPDASDRY